MVWFVYTQIPNIDSTNVSLPFIHLWLKWKNLEQSARSSRDNLKKKTKRQLFRVPFKDQSVNRGVGFCIGAPAVL